MDWRDLVISCFAAPAIPPGVRFDDPPAWLNWPGQPRAGGHPTWKPSADGLRVGGRVLPALVNRYARGTGVAWGATGYARPRRIAVIGFSAGFGGVKALLSDDRDRAAIDAVILIDTPHAPIVGGEVYLPSVRPFVEYARAAAVGPGMYCATWGSIPTGPTVSSAASTNQTIFREALAGLPGTPPAPAPPPGLLVPHRAPNGVPAPLPDQVWGSADAWGLHYPGGDEASHIRQAQIVQPDVISHALARRWNVIA